MIDREDRLKLNKEFRDRDELEGKIKDNEDFVKQRRYFIANEKDRGFHQKIRTEIREGERLITRQKAQLPTLKLIAAKTDLTYDTVISQNNIYHKCDCIL